MVIAKHWSKKEEPQWQSQALRSLEPTNRSSETCWKASTDGENRRYLVQEVPRRVPKAGGARSRVITLRE